MLDLLQHLALGFGVALSPMNLLLCLIGAMVGTLIGVLPGVGPLATIAMLLPITFGLPPVGALIMLAGIYYGAQYGGFTTPIPINNSRGAGFAMSATSRVHTINKRLVRPAACIP